MWVEKVREKGEVGEKGWEETVYYFLAENFHATML